MSPRISLAGIVWGSLWNLARKKRLWARQTLCKDLRQFFKSWNLLFIIQCTTVERQLVKKAAYYLLQKLCRQLKQRRYCSSTPAWVWATRSEANPEWQRVWNRFCFPNMQQKWSPNTAYVHAARQSCKTINFYSKPFPIPYWGAPTIINTLSAKTLIL